MFITPKEWRALSLRNRMLLLQAAVGRLMYCVIQKVQRKNLNTEGHAKELLVEVDTFTIDDEELTEYNYQFSEEQFERPVLDAYKNSIHHSYRENGKIKKK